MKRRAATRREHLRFCELEGWRTVSSARSTPTRHHITFELPLDDGRILRTRVSRPANTESYGPSLWLHILRDQLCVTQREFWMCVDDGLVPTRSTPMQPPPSTALPAGLAHQLVHVLHLSSAEIETLSLDEATQLMNQHWASPND